MCRGMPRCTHCNFWELSPLEPELVWHLSQTCRSHKVGQPCCGYRWRPEAAFIFMLKACHVLG